MFFKFYFILLLLSSFLNAKEFVISKNTTNLEINKIHYLKNQNYKLAELKNKKFLPYEKKPNELYKFPFENVTSYWVKFDIINKSDKDQEELIYVSYPDIRYVTFYEKTTADKNYKAIFDNRAKDRVFTSKLRLKKDEKKSILIKLDNEVAPMLFNLEILNDNTFYKKEKQTLIIHSIFMGMMVFAMIYFFIAFMMIRKYLFILYVIHIFGFVIFQIFIQGYPKIYSSDLILLDQIKISMAMVSACSFALFVLFFLNNSLNKIYKNVMYFIIIIVAICIMLYLNNLLSPQITAGLALVQYLLVLFGSYSAYKKENRYALNIFISSLVIVVGVISHSLATVFQLIPLYEYTLHSLAYANLIEVMIILFMFVTYFKKTYEEKENIYLEKLSLEKSFSKKLEKEVALKTKELKEAKEKAEKLARIDELTKIFNRRAFMEEAKYLIKESKRYETSLSLILLDIDYFKKINDTYGHEAGDVVLKTFSATLSLEIRETDILARIGGEEFVVMLPHTNLVLAVNIAKKLKENINKLEITYKDKKIKITSSFGISEFDQNDDIKTLLDKADKALYKAKNTGRDKIEIEK